MSERIAVRQCTLMRQVRRNRLDFCIYPGAALYNDSGRLQSMMQWTLFPLAFLAPRCSELAFDFM
jgi:hypothetical protein